MTNHHVISGGSTIQVMIPHKNKSKTVDARVLGSDDITDLAVLEIDDQYVTTVAQFGNSATLQSGEPAIAIGDPARARIFHYRWCHQFSEAHH